VSTTTQTSVVLNGSDDDGAVADEPAPPGGRLRRGEGRRLPVGDAVAHGPGSIDLDRRIGQTHLAVAHGLGSIDLDRRIGQTHLGIAAT
jgi:hypothetical protein